MHAYDSKTLEILALVLRNTRKNNKPGANSGHDETHSEKKKKVVEKCEYTQC
jgi:hypothetical protein